MTKQIQDTIRDSHPSFADVQVGKSCDLREKAQGRCLKNAHRTFEQGIQCVQVNSMNALVSLQDTVMVIHSPLGCSGCAAFGAIDRLNVYKHHRGRDDAPDSHVISSALGEKEVILGGEKRLEETIQKAVERYNPKIVFILSSCAAAIIGDDIDAVAERMEKKYRRLEGREILFAPVHCEGFKSRNHATGYDLALATLQNYVIREARPPKQKGLINLFATHSLSWADQEEMKRMLKAIGLEANILPYNASYEDIMKIPAAEYNISVCQIFGDEYIKFLKEKYDIPYAVTCMPIGSQSTNRWLRAIAKLAGKEKEAEAFIESESAAVAGEVEKIKKKTDGLRACLTAGTGRGFAAATLIGDYGMKLLCMHTPYYDEAYIDDFKRLEELHGSDFLVNIADMQPYEQVNLLKKFKPDVFIGMSNWVSRLGIPSLHILDSKRPTFGYRGVLYLGRKIEDALDNNNFNKNLSQFSKNAYREEWYKKDAFSYLQLPE
ncbi:MAG: nitrogen fixation protein NifE [Treponema sp.]|uniref:nitrogenase component 1 n=1 Tax=Treponema sp. TaxID=166 RepID=UPI0025FBC228|nr:nitrogenase component 1 [Treponema sp.]MBQ8679725.1 nitrogen fixation protein NifE [Treponema sp.]